MSQGRFIELLDRRLMLDGGPWMQAVGRTPEGYDWQRLPSGDMVGCEPDISDGVSHGRLIRYSPTGEMRWSQPYDGYVYSIAAGRDGSIWTVSADSDMGVNFYVNRYDDTGALQRHVFLVSGGLGAGEATVMYDGRLAVFAAGTHSGSAHLSNGDDIYGPAIILVRRSGDIDSVIKGVSSKIAVTPDNQIIAVAANSATSTRTGYSVIRYADTGMVVWRIDSLSGEYLDDLAVDSRGNAYLISEPAEGSTELRTLDTYGNVIAHMSLGNARYCQISLAPDDQVLVTWTRLGTHAILLNKDGSEAWSGDSRHFGERFAGRGQVLFGYFEYDASVSQTSWTWCQRKDVVDGILQIPGTPGADRVTVSVAHGMVTATMNSDVLSIRQSDIRGIYCTLGAGDDSFTMIGDLPCTVYGNQGNDTIQGGAGADYLHGGQGNDLIWAGAGNDTILGGNGNDRLYGNPGDDSIDAGAGTNEYVRGGLGNDTLVGSYGNSTLCGCDGDDDIRSADLRYRAKNSRTVMYGDAGNDAITTLIALDRVWGGAGADRFVLSDAYRPDTVMRDFQSEDILDCRGGVNYIPVD